MASLELAEGSLRVTYPDSYGVEPARRAAKARRGGRPPGASVWAGPVGPTSEVSAALLDALATQNLELVEPFELVPTAQAGPSGQRGQRGQRSHGPNRAGRVHVAVDLPEGQDSVILLEQDGFFSWHLPTGHDTARRPSRHPAPAGAPRASRRADLAAGPPTTAQGREGPPSRAVRFEIDVRPAIPARPSARTRPALGPFGDFVVGRVKAYVLKFASPLIPGALMAFLERNINPGLVLMTGTDVKSWTHVDTLAQVELPSGRPARILLFIHGTFSNTAGSYGVLTATAPGQQFLTAAGGAYDAVIGFDHRTLSRDPLENALDLLARLSARQPDFAPAIDIVSYSRGALVARSLIEYVLPSSTWHADIGTVVFVGGTNAGTQLAEPDNWKDFVDLYTNLAVGTARSVGFATGTAPATEIVSGLVNGIGAFVKYLVVASVTDRRIPGLAAMEPDGPFVTGINQAQPGQPAAHPGTSSPPISRSPSSMTTMSRPSCRESWLPSWPTVWPTG